MSTHDGYALAAAAGLAALHVVAGRLAFLRAVPRSAVLSVAGGVSVAYVFVHLLPEVAEAQEALSDAASGVLPAVERHAYLVALLGLVSFYGVERASVRSRRRIAARPVDAPSTGGAAGGEEGTEAAIYALSIGSFAVYNALIGYLLVGRAEEEGWANVVLFSVAMGVHFVINDFGLREHHRRRYHRQGRWLLGAAVLAGWAIGASTEVSEAFLAVLVALLGGGVVLNVLKEELPEERDSNFWAFAAGAAGYAAVLVAI